MFPSRGFVSFVTYHQSMFYMPTRLSKYNIYCICVPQFQLSYISNTTNTLHKNLFGMFHNVRFMWWGYQYLELQYWEDLIKSFKIVSDILMFVPWYKPPGYKERIIFFGAFTFGEVFIIIYWMENMKSYVSYTVE